MNTIAQNLTNGASIEQWQQEAGLNWNADSSAVMYKVGEQAREMKGRKILYRSDNGNPLSVVSNRYKPVQPSEVLEFYRDLTARHGFQLETAGSFKGGRKIWALANTHEAIVLPGNDHLKNYLLLATSFDGSMATTARHTSVRVYCENTLTIATKGKADATVRHSAAFDADKVKLDLKVGDAWVEFSRQATAMSHRPITHKDSLRYLFDVYYELANDEAIKEFHEDKKHDREVRKFLDRMNTALFEAPGAKADSSRGMLWGVLNAVTYDVDHAMRAHTSENRMDKALFGSGETLKQRALEKALVLL